MQLLHCHRWVDLGARCPPIEDLFGREADVHRLLHLIHARRYVEVRGERGIGKSTLLTETGRFLSMRRDTFVEVRWIDNGKGDVHSRQDTATGLDCLASRLAFNPSRNRVLLLLDELDAEIWSKLQPLLRFSSVHMLAAPSQNSKLSESDASAGGNAFACIGQAAHAAIAAGLKPVTFELGPLEPFAQVRLFLRRAPRPLRAAELHCKPASPNDDIFQPPQRPSEYLSLADTSLRGTWWQSSASRRCCSMLRTACSSWRSCTGEGVLS